MRLAVLVVLLAPMTGTLAAAEVNLVLWNGERLFDRTTVKKRAADLAEFGAHHKRADVIILDEVTSLDVVNATRDEMGFKDYHTACSDFAQDDNDTFNSLEVGLISRFPLANVVEFDQTPDNSGKPGEPAEKILITVNVPGITAAETPRGFLTADIPKLGLTLVATHLKSSRGAGARFGDLENAKKREHVAAAIVKFVADKFEVNPTATVLVAGDMNVGETDKQKNGFRLTEDKFRAADGDLYDDTHAIFSAGLIKGLHMASLTKGLAAETYDDTQFAGVGPIDCMYVAGKQAGDFTLAKKSDKTFGSDHFSVSTRFLFSGVAPPPPPRASIEGKLRIAALLPNPAGDDGGKEWVSLKNGGTQAIDLAGWRMQDKAKHFVKLSGVVAAGGERMITLRNGQMPLNNGGDKVELINPAGEVVHTITYSNAQVASGKVIRY